MHLPAVQQLRAVAALLVVWFHAMEQLPALGALLPRSVGYLGVDIFFVISGFVMMLSTASKPTKPLDFIKQRLIRVAPLYWFFTIAVAALAIVLPSMFRTTNPSLSHVLQSLAFWPHWSPSHAGKLWPILVPGWSLVYEMFFYLLFALGLMLGIKARLAYLSSIIIALSAAGAALRPFESAPLMLITDSVILEFLAGIWVARLVLRLRPSAAVGMSWFLMCFGAALLVCHGYVTPSRLLVVLGSALMVLGASTMNGPLVSARWFTLLGDASYSLYLSHLFALGAARALWMKLLGAPASAAQGALFIALCLLMSSVVAIVVYRFVEMPLTARVRRWVDAGNFRQA